MTTNHEHKIDAKERTKDVLLDDMMDFKSMLLSEPTSAGLKRCKFEKPSPIQLKAIPLGRCGFDLIVKSKSGTGKTVVFSVIALEMVDSKLAQLQVLILAPTREIAVQIRDVIRELSANIEGLKTEAFIGGLPVETDIKNLAGCHIAIGCPGRIKSLITKNNLKTDSIKLFVLDEADKLMEDNFQKDINHIYHKIPQQKQMLAISATYPDDLDTFLAKYMHTPTFVSPTVDQPLLLGLKQFISILKANQSVIQQMNVKTAEILRLLSKISFTQCLIFSNFQSRAESMSNILNSSGWKTKFISGSQNQTERLKVMSELKDCECRILLTTDLTSRGIDAENVDLVINMEVPHDASTYLHRMGRAGRYGSKGICVTLAFKGKEVVQLQQIMGMIGGTDLSVSLLPNDERFPDNLWECEAKNLEQIFGVIDASIVNETGMRIKSIKKSLLELKRCQENDERSSGVEGAENNGMQEDGKEEVEEMDVLITTALKNFVEYEYDKERIEKNVKAGNVIDKDSDTLSLLQKLSNEESIDENTLENSQTTDILTKLAQADPNFDSSQILSMLQNDDTENSNKRKRTDKLTDQLEKRERADAKILHRNMFLLNNTKLLDNQNISRTEKDDFNENITSFLTYLKDADSTELQSNSCEETLEKVDKSNDEIEDLFVHAYNFSVKPGSRHWLDCIGEKFDENAVEPIVEQAHNLLCADDEDDEYYDDEEDENPMDEDEENPLDEVVYTETEQRYNDNTDNYNDNLQKYETKHRKNRHDKIALNKHKFKTGEVGNFESYRDHEYGDVPSYSVYFQQCSDMLEGKVEEFDNVTSYEEWMVKWRNQVMGVRDYVQQNVYLHEMNKYQYYGH